MHPPTEQAIGQALQILLDSSNSENPATSRESDQSLIEVQNDRIKAYEALIESTNAALNKELQQLLHRRNMLSPFHRLSLSTFTSIMALCVEENPDVNSARPTILQRLASVSSDWLRAIKSAPSLWAVIDASWNQQTIQLFLRKSQSAPLNIRSVTFLGGSQKLLDFFTTILPHRARWQSITLKNQAAESIEVPTHILESIQISTRYPYRMSVTLTSAEPLPTIKVETLERQSFTWAGKMIGLWVLDLQGLSRDVPTCKQVMEVIAQSPQLEIISLSKWKDPDEDPDTVVEAIHLPRLHTLRCENVPSSIQYAIAQSVAAPGCQLIELGFGGTREGTVQMDLLHNFTNGIGDRLQSFMQTQNRATVIFSGSEITLSSPRYCPYSSAESGVNMKFFVGWDLEEQIPLLRWITTQIPEHADLTIETSHRISVEALQILSATSGLICSGWSFRTVAKPTVSDNQVSWPLPHLSRLDVRDSVLTAKEFKEFVWDRWGTCDKTHTQMERRLGIMVRPRALTVLKLPNSFVNKVSRAEKHALANCHCRDP